MQDVPSPSLNPILPKNAMYFRDVELKQYIELKVRGRLYWNLALYLHLDVIFTFGMLSCSGVLRRCVPISIRGAQAAH